MQLNSEYTGAEIDRVNKEAAIEAIKSGSVDAALVSAQGETLAKYNDALIGARQHFAQVKAT
jgi:hypothetical protein